MFHLSTVEAQLLAGKKKLHHKVSFELSENSLALWKQLNTPWECEVVGWHPWYWRRRQRRGRTQRRGRETERQGAFPRKAWRELQSSPCASTLPLGHQQHPSRRLNKLTKNQPRWKQQEETEMVCMWIQDFVSSLQISDKKFRRQR